MLQFNSVIMLNQKGVLLTVEELDTWPDADGYISFAITANDRDSVIYVNMNYFRPPTFYTAEDAEEYFEKINYPQLPPSLSKEDVFTREELFTIGQAIATYVFQEQSRSRLKE